MKKSFTHKIIERALKPVINDKDAQAFFGRIVELDDAPGFMVGDLRVDNVNDAFNIKGHWLADKDLILGQ